MSTSDSKIPTIAVVGCGGLGGPVALCLTRDLNARLVLIDPDTVERSNLHRQVQFTDSDLGAPKVSALTSCLLRRGYPSERLTAVAAHLDESNIDALLADADLVIEGTDSFANKFLVNDWCRAHGVALALGACQRYEGQVFRIPAEGGPCYRCLFEAAPDDDDVTSCTTAGVLGPVPGVVGAALAMAASSLLRAEEGPFLQVWNDLRTSVTPRRLDIAPRATCPCRQAHAITFPPSRTPRPSLEV